jgi:WD40 repeat protein
MDAGFHKVSYSPDGLTLAGSCSGKILQWEAATGEHIKSVNCGSGFCFSFSPDGLAFAIGDGFGIRQCAAATGEPLGAMLKGHTDRVTCVTYSPNGPILASSSRDKTIRLWVAATGQPHGPVLIGHSQSVSSIAYSPDGANLVSGGDCSICMWQAHAPFHLLWRTRSAESPLCAVGLQLTGAVGLRADQIALLGYAQFSEEARKRFLERYQRYAKQDQPTSDTYNWCTVS